MCEKLGVAVDWSSYNMLPYLQDVCNRYATYRIVDCAIGVVFGVLLVLSVIIWRKLYRYCMENTMRTTTAYRVHWLL